MLPQLIKQQLIQKLNIANLSLAEQEKIVSALEDLFNLAIYNFILTKLDTLKVKTFISLWQDNIEQEKALQFAKENIPDFDKEIKKVIEHEINSVK